MGVALVLGLAAGLSGPEVADGLQKGEVPCLEGAGGGRIVVFRSYVRYLAGSNVSGRRVVRGL